MSKFSYRGKKSTETTTNDALRLMCCVFWSNYILWFALQNVNVLFDQTNIINRTTRACVVVELNGTRFTEELLEIKGPHVGL